MPVYHLSNHSDTASGGAGDDTLYGWDAANAPGDEGPADDSDILSGRGGNDWLAGGNGNDGLWSGAGRDALFGGAGDDTLVAGGRHDTLQGGDGNDDLTVQGPIGDALIDGGAGLDSLRLTLAGAGQRFRVLGPDAQMVLRGGAVITGIEQWYITGTAAADRIRGGDFGGSILGNGGDDWLAGGAGRDFVVGAGHSTLHGGAGDDTLGGALVYGGRGDDVLGEGGNTTGGIRFMGGAGNDYLLLGIRTGLLDGGAGRDCLEFDLSDTGTAVAVSMTTPGALGHLPRGASFLHVEYLDATFTPRDDTVTGGDFADRVRGQLGADLIRGGGGDDNLSGDLTDDQINPLGLSSGDTLYGEVGNDRLYGQLGGDVLFGGLGDDALYGGLDSDALNGDEGNDALYGGTGSNALFGGAGADTLAGAGQMAQYLYGGAADDNLTGGAGNDVLNGGPGSDALTGGAGADKFDFNTAPMAGEADRITDFMAGDQLVLFARAFAGIAAGALTEGDFGTRVIYDAGTGALRFDADGAGGAAAVVFAYVTAGSVVTAADVLIV